MHNRHSPTRDRPSTLDENGSVLSGKRVLLVEDEYLIAQMACDMLEEGGAVPVGPASTIAHALNILNAEGVDAAVLDVNLQGERSDALAAVLQERAIPFVIVTGYQQSSVREDGAHVLEKPYTRLQLTDALERVLAQRDRTSN